ncbi:hypothetical protein [uncultured Dialister sp.]|uniref:hypothetical protein n=1 Tax=uncultured Dialister sp. TaxID=278064 RepID=UPI0026E0BD51|nr:hypothetical protein [uncultured Dialister sp.]
MKRRLNAPSGLFCRFFGIVHRREAVGINSVLLPKELLTALALHQIIGDSLNHSCFD